MKTRPRHAFVLAEFVIALVFVAVVLGPLLLFVSRIDDLNTAVGQQSRKEAWRSFLDQAIAAGIDPSHASALSPDRNPAVANITPPAVRELSVATTPGLPRVIPLQAVLDASVAEPRAVGSGLRLGSGLAVAPLGPPRPPLPPITLAPPEVNPPDGSVIAMSALRPGEAGAPHTLLIAISPPGGDHVEGRLNQPARTFSAAGTAQQTVTAVDLLTGVTGSAWTEYAGDPAHGDRAVQLEDGRMRWLVPAADGRRQTYEPSGFVRFAYRLDLGAPVFVTNEGEAPSGASIAVDYARYAAAQRGAETLRLDFPSLTKAAFGNHWPAASIGFSWSFGTTAGPFSGDARPFFLPEALALWSDSVAVTATPVLPDGATAASAAWTFTRTKTPLGIPVLSNPVEAGGFFTPGALEFSAPAIDGITVGRLSFEAGAYLSTGPTLSVEVIP